MTPAVVTLTPQLAARMGSVDWDIDWRGTPRAATLGGVSGFVFNAFPRWVGTLDLGLWQETIGTYRAARFSAQGRLNAYRIPMYDPALFDIVAYETGYQNGIPFNTGSLFSTGWGFGVTPFYYAAAAAAVGDTTLDIDIAPIGAAPVPGQILSHNDWPFGVTSVELVSGNTYRLTVQMALRSAVSVNDEVLAVGHGWFVSEDDGGAVSYDGNGFARPRVSLVEDLRAR